MPHIIVEYSPNLGKDGERIAALLGELAKATAASGLFPTAGLRVRAHRSDIHHVGDGRKDAGFVHIQLRIGPGRSVEQQEQIAAELFELTEGFFADDLAQRPLALSLEIVELGIRHNRNNLRSYIDAPDST